MASLKEQVIKNLCANMTKREKREFFEKVKWEETKRALTLPHFIDNYTIKRGNG